MEQEYLVRELDEKAVPNGAAPESFDAADRSRLQPGHDIDPASPWSNLRYGGGVLRLFSCDGGIPDPIACITITAGFVFVLPFDSAVVVDRVGTDAVDHVFVTFNPILVIVAV